MMYNSHPVLKTSIQQVNSYFSNVPKKKHFVIFFESYHTDSHKIFTDCSIQLYVLNESKIMNKEVCSVKKFTLEISFGVPLI